jgi:ABC-type amino acid transport substrate-binding protein/tRNA A-37 threonylcarbamoyl transferase component Bud32
MPERFGSYELLEELDRGGMGVVYKARHTGLQRLVALKLILKGRLASPAEKRRFHTEARAVARLDHPNIVPIYDVGEHDGQPYFSMKLVEGGSLKDYLARGRGDLAAGVRLLVLVARAVQHAHEHSILHRDLKPGNILLDSQERPHVADFGLAKVVAGAEGTAESLTQSGTVLGTPGYMAPEQAAGLKQPTPAVDVYSLGAILYELLTGQPPFRGANLLETLELTRSREPDRPRSLNPAVPRDLEVICLRCLDKDPACRYPTPAALADDLERWLHAEPVRPPRASMVPSIQRWWRRHASAARRTAAAAALLAALVLLSVALLSRDQSWERVKKARLLRIATDPTYPPMEYKVGGRLVGYDIELAEAIARNLESPVEVQFTEVEWDWNQIVTRLEAGEFDVVISGVMVTPERGEQVAFTEYLWPAHYFVWRRGEGSFQKLHDLADKVVAVPRDTGTEQLVEELKRDGINPREMIRLPGNVAPFTAVRRKEAEVTLAHAPVARYFASQEPTLESAITSALGQAGGLPVPWQAGWSAETLSKTPTLEVSKGPLGYSMDPNRVGIAFRKKDSQLKERIDAALKTPEMKRIREKLHVKWFGP